MAINMLFSTKANTLLYLNAYDEFNIPPVYVVDALLWQKNKHKIVEEILVFAQSFATSLAVRSSCAREDGELGSEAGAFTSVLRVAYTEKQEIEAAIRKVFASYGQVHATDQVFVQPMIEDIAVSGVIMTRALDDGSPYYVINYDDESGKTESITGGFGGTKTVYVYRDAQDSDFDSQRLRTFVRFAQRVEEVCQRNDLDMEFCQSRKGVIHLLQVRPICAQHHWIQRSRQHVANKISYIVDFVEKRTGAWPELFGKNTILGIMPDWNPAEIIGVTPRPLASSLYRELITKRVWRMAREQMGYRAMPPDELMLILAGRPYIDVRVSLNSFLPQGLDASISENLVNAWLEYLDTHPHLHDKIEFDVAQTVLDFCFDTHFDSRYAHVLNRKDKSEFKLALQKLTNNCLELGAQGTMAWAFDAVTQLEQRQAQRGQQNFAIMKEHTLLPHMVLLCEECKKLGTLPFAILARHAFIAEALLRTAVERGALCSERLIAFKKSLHTVAGEMSHDFLRVSEGALSHGHFMQRYGHLRPSTYDILSLCYAHKEDLFMQGDFTLPHVQALETFVFSAKEQKDISKLMVENGLQGDAFSLESYARKAICGREWAKFVFSKNLSDMLELIAFWGSKYDIDRETLSFLDVRHVLEWASHTLLQPPQTYFESLAAEGRKLFTLSRSLKLGYLIRSPRDVYIIPQHRSAPNFIGKTSVEAPIAFLDAHSHCSENIAHCIVCIENADPGFDWIFTRQICGLVTKFGGTNSHMAIRCAEYGIPAVIGAGEVLFEKVSTAKRCILNAGNHTLQAL